MSAAMIPPVEVEVVEVVGTHDELEGMIDEVARQVRGRLERFTEKLWSLESTNPAVVGEIRARREMRRR